jgi:hypothetical protein
MLEYLFINYLSGNWKGNPGTPNGGAPNIIGTLFSAEVAGEAGELTGEAGDDVGVAGEIGIEVGTGGTLTFSTCTTKDL